MSRKSLLLPLSSAGFSLMELSVVLVIVSAMVWGGITVGKSQIEASRAEQTRQKIEAINKALEIHRKSSNRLPCPADARLSESDANFGVAADMPGNCLDGAIKAPLTNGGDAVGGSVPVRALGLPNDYAVDGWGHRFTYAIDRRMSEDDAYAKYSLNDSDIGVFDIKDSSGASLTAKSVMALVSHGANGHGAFRASGGANRIVADSTNADELENANVDATGAVTAFNTTFVMKAETQDPTSATGGFDDIVAYKTAADFRTVEEIKATVTPPPVDTTAPLGYSVTWQTSPDPDYVNAANQETAAFQIDQAEVGATYSYSIASSGGGTAVTGAGFIADSPLDLSAIDLSGLPDGTLTLSSALTDGNGNAGPDTTATSIKDTVAPAGYSVTWLTDPINTSNQENASFRVNGAEVGAMLTYVVTSSAGGPPLAGTAAVSSNPMTLTDLNLAALEDGTVTAAITLTDPAGNVGAVVSGDVTKLAPPPAMNATWGVPYVNLANRTSVPFRIHGAPLGSSWTATITSSGGGSQTYSGTITADPQVTNVNLSASPADGNLTLSVEIDSWPAITAPLIKKDTVAPSGYTMSWGQTLVTYKTNTSVTINLAAAEKDAIYTLVITSSGGGTVKPPLGVVTAASHAIAGLKLDGLGDGTLTASLYLTDAVGNQGATKTATILKGSDPCWIKIPAASLIPGAACWDGTIYAGRSPDAPRGNPPMFTTTSYVANAICWNDCNNEGWVGVFAAVDGDPNWNQETAGQRNTNRLHGRDSNDKKNGNQPHRAAEKCTGSWYLPAVHEAQVMWSHRNAGALAGTMNNHFWSSREIGTQRAKISEGTAQDKNHKYSVRCVRNDLSPRG